jgi:hypothetical protein
MSRAAARRQVPIRVSCNALERPARIERGVEIAPYRLMADLQEMSADGRG